MSEEREPIFEFPTSLSLKAIGWSSVEFASIVTGIIRQHVPTLSDLAVSERPSSGGKYTSVTVTFIAETQPQLDAIYRDLHAHDQVIFVL